MVILLLNDCDGYGRHICQISFKKKRIYALFIKTNFAILRIFHKINFAISKKSCIFAANFKFKRHDFQAKTVSKDAPMEK